MTSFATTTINVTAAIADFLVVFLNAINPTPLATTIKNSITFTLYSVIDLADFVDIYLRAIDPTLLQNVLLGALALLVPIGVGILGFYFTEKSKNNIESNLELYILLGQVLKARSIAVLSLSILVLLSIYDYSMWIRIIVVPLLYIFIVWLLFIPLKNIWKWLFRNIEEFAKTFLRNLNLKRDTETAIKSWQALWLGDAKQHNERDFTQIFISHIDEAVRIKDYELTLFLAESYVKNINKRTRFIIGHEILPKVFEWSERFWEAQQGWLHREDREEKLQRVLSKIPVQTVKQFLQRLTQRVRIKNEDFWNWHYFQTNFFIEIVKILLKDSHGPFQLFSAFKKYIQSCEEKLESLSGDDEEHWWSYIKGLFATFCPVFFETINEVESKYDIWHHYFPPEWKVTSANSKRRIPRIFLHEFLEWSRNRLFVEEGSARSDDKLYEVVNGLFPNVHNRLFPAFVGLLFTGDLEEAMRRRVNFFFTNTMLSWSGEKTDEEIRQMQNDQDKSQRQETVNIIFEYFPEWKMLKPYKEDITDEEVTKWDEYSQEEKNKIVDRVRKLKFQNAIAELKSEKFIEIAKQSEHFERRRQILTELMESLLARIP